MDEAKNPSVIKSSRVFVFLLRIKLRDVPGIMSMAGKNRKAFMYGGMGSIKQVISENSVMSSSKWRFFIIVFFHLFTYQLDAI